jgi:hypothetical protein
MSWIALTPAAIQARLAKDELESYLDAGEHAADGLDALGEIIAQVTAMVRGKVASCRDNLSKLGPAGTIPDECLFAASTIARDALVGSLPLSEGSTELRREELRKAHDFLDSVARCEVRIEDATGEIAEAAQGTAASSYGGSPLLNF